MTEFLGKWQSEKHMSDPRKYHFKQGFVGLWKSLVENNNWEQLIGRVEWSSKGVDWGWGGFVEVRMLCCLSYFPFIPTPAVSIPQASDGAAISQTLQSPSMLRGGIKLLISLQTRVVVCWWDTAESPVLLFCRFPYLSLALRHRGEKRFAIGNFSGFGDACASPASLECWHHLLLDNYILSVWGGVLVGFFLWLCFLRRFLCDGFI